MFNAIFSIVFLLTSVFPTNFQVNNIGSNVVYEQKNIISDSLSISNRSELPLTKAFIKVDRQNNYPRTENNSIYFTGTTSSNCDSVSVEAVNTQENVEDYYELTTYSKGDTTFKYGVREDWNNLGAGTNGYVFTANCQGNQIVKDSLFMTLQAPITTTLPSIPSLSNDNYYTNARGNEIHSPAYSNSLPSGASAECLDGTYSFSQSRSGTCSHHGGVATWLDSTTSLSTNSRNVSEVVYRRTGCDYMILENPRGSVVGEWYSGRDPSEGDTLEGDLNHYGFKEAVNNINGSRTKLWIDDYMLSKSSAMENIDQHCPVD